MNVIYDISPVGNRPETRTGLARSAWSTACSLYQQLGCHISFSATGSIWAAIQTENLLVTHPQLSSALNPVSHFAKQIYEYQERLSELQQRTRGLYKVAIGISERNVLQMFRLLNIMRAPVNSQVLEVADIFHSSYARVPPQIRRALPNRHVLTVNDLTPLILNKRYFTPGQEAITRRIIDSIQTEDWVIAISESTRCDLLEYRQINPEKVVTIPLAASKELFYPENNLDIIREVRKKYKVPTGDYLLTLHSLASHKNLRCLIQSFNKLIKQEQISNLSLVVCGGQTRSANQIATMLNINSDELKQIHFTGYVDEADLAAIYSGAHAFVFPSLYEGFGLPVLEAMQCGCPVIASNRSSLPEIVSDVGLLIDPENQDNICEAMLKLLRNNSLRLQLTKSGIERAKLYNWEKTTAEIINLYRLILN